MVEDDRGGEAAQQGGGWLGAQAREAETLAALPQQQGLVGAG